MTLGYEWLLPVETLLRQRLKEQQLPHALLIVGHEMQGALALQDWLVATLLCTQSEHDPCGQCHSCQLLVAGHHPDLLQLQPEGKGQLIKVDAVRELNQFCQATAQQGAAQVAKVVAADRLNLASANALLKTLEEPTAQTYLILQTANPGALLPTIRSRLQRLICPKPTFDQSMSWLAKQGVSQVDCERYLNLSMGAPLQALKWAQGEGVPAYVEWQTCLLKQCQSPKLSLTGVHNISVDDIANLITTWLDILSAMVRCVHSRHDTCYLNHLHATHDWLALTHALPSLQFWQTLYDETRVMQQQLQRANHLNAHLLLEQLWLRLAKHFIKAQAGVGS